MFLLLRVLSYTGKMEPGPVCVCWKHTDSDRRQLGYIRVQNKSGISNLQKVTAVSPHFY